MSQQYDGDDRRDMPPEPPPPERDKWLAAAQASLNGIRSNPALVGCPSHDAAQMAADDADELMERLNDES